MPTVKRTSRKPPHPSKLIAQHRVHLSPTILRTLRASKQVPEPSSKPNGLWYSCGNEWIEFIRDQMRWRAQESYYMYEIHVDLASMVVIRDIHEFDAFQQRFGVPDEDGDMMPNWAAVAREYGGVEICPYISARRMVDWYYPWDVASGCVWDPAVIISLSRGGKVGPFT